MSKLLFDFLEYFLEYFHHDRYSTDEIRTLADYLSSVICVRRGNEHK